MSSGLVRAVKKPFTTVGTSHADYIVTGTADNTVLQTVVNAMADGQRLFLKDNTYNLNARVAFNLGVSDFFIEGESKDGTVIKAAQSIYDSGQNQHFGMFTIGSHTTEVKNITIRNLTFDCNNQLKTQALTITGGSNSGGGASTKNVLIEDVIFKNMGQNSSDTARSPLEFISSNIPFGNFGRIDGITIKNCEFDTSEYFLIYFLGNYFKNVKIKDCYFHDNQNHTINFVQYSVGDHASARVRSNEDWEISGCRFINTKLASSGSSIADISDDNRTGIKNFKIHHNYFGPQTANEDEDKISIDTHGSWGLEVTNNYFDQVSEPLSLGHSDAGSYYKIDPVLMTLIQGNTFYRCVKPGIDGDANMFTKWADNYFIYCNDFGIGGYSRHWPSIYEGNTFYNCGSNPIGAEEYHKAAIEIVGDGYIVRHNTFIDDRLLADPVTAPTLSQVAGGALGARTYYVKYTWANDTGETLASNEANLSVSANNLLKVTMPTSNPYPSGATKIKIYVSTSTNTETLQDSMDIAYQIETGSAYWPTYAWTEPTTGLVAGAALPGANTTEHLMLYGIYEVGGAGGLKLPNHYYGNHFYGIETPILESASYTRIRRDNFSNESITATGEVPLEGLPYIEKTSTYTAIATDEVINCTSGTFTVTFPAVADLPGGKVYRVKNSGAGTITVDGNSSETIDGAATDTLAAGEFATYVSTGSAWIIT